MISQNRHMPASQMSKREEMSTRIIASIMGSGDVQLESLLTHDDRKERHRKLTAGVAEITDALLAELERTS